MGTEEEEEEDEEDEEEEEEEEEEAVAAATTNTDGSPQTAEGMAHRVSPLAAAACLPPSRMRWR
jgi:hypothetical protein